MTRRGWSVVALAALALVAALMATGVGTRAWRTAYPFLPPRVQAVPYRLRALVQRPSTPIALPTPRPASPSAPTAQPTADAMPSATADAAPTATMLAIAGVPRRTGVTHLYQTWNNCGPATISMALSAFGLDEGQARAAVRLKPNPDDKNVSLDELARYAAERGAGATLRFGARQETLFALVHAGLPVIVETWFVPEPGDEMGHYRLVTGFDAERREWTMADSYLGPAVSVPFDRFDAEWRAFNRALLVVHPLDRLGDVVAIVGDGGAAMWIGAAATAATEIEHDADAFGWFNLGTSLLGGGDGAGAATAFDRARSAGLPWRMLWYQFGPFEAYASVGRWADITALADANLANAADLEESWYWLGRARAAAGDLDGARKAWRRAIELNPLYAAPAVALAALDGSTP